MPFDGQPRQALAFDRKTIFLAALGSAQHAPSELLDGEQTQDKELIEADVFSSLANNKVDYTIFFYGACAHSREPAGMKRCDLA
jgi:hypothetical protein